MAVRQHLYALQQEKLVTAEERPVPLGRPAKFWTLTQRGGAAVSRRLCRAECRTHHVGAGRVRPRGDGAPARCAGRPAACRLCRADHGLGAAGEESAATREDSCRRRVYGRGEARRQRLPLHRESLPDLRGSHGVPGFLRQRARSLPLGAGAGRQRRAGRAHPFGRSTVRLPNRGDRVEYAARRRCEAIPRHRARRRCRLCVGRRISAVLRFAARAGAARSYRHCDSAKARRLQHLRFSSTASRSGPTDSRRVAKADDKAPPQAAPTQKPPAERRSCRADAAAPGPREPRDVLARRRARRPQRDRLVPAGSSVADAADHQERPCCRHGQHGARMRLVPSSERQRTPRERAAGRAAGRVLHAAASGFPQRPAEIGRPAEAEHEHDDRAGEGR